MKALPKTTRELGLLVRQRLVDCGRICESLAAAKRPEDRVTLGLRAAAAGRSLRRARKAFSRAAEISPTPPRKPRPLSGAMRDELAHVKIVPRLIRGMTGRALEGRGLIELSADGAQHTITRAGLEAL